MTAYFLSDTVKVTTTGSLPITGSVCVTQCTTPWQVTGSVGITGITFPETVTVTGSVGIATLPSITGSVSLSQPATVNQGTNPWTVTGSVGVNALPPITGTVGVSSMPNLTGSFNVTNSLFSVTGSLALSQPAVVTQTDQNGNAVGLAFGGDGRLRVGTETLMFFDPFDGPVTNTVLWNSQSLNMTGSQSVGSLQLNSTGNQLSGAYSSYVSDKQFLFTGEYPLYTQFKTKLTPVTGSLIEFGFGNAVGTTTSVNGLFIRTDATGSLKVVMNFGGSETIAPLNLPINPSTFYSFELTAFEDELNVTVDDASGNQLANTTIGVPTSQAAPFSTSHVPIFARVINTAATASPVNLTIGNVTVSQLDLVTNKSWSETMASLGRSATTNPLSGSGTTNSVNSTAPALASLSNTVPGYFTMGGEFAFAMPSAAETDYVLFAYQVPSAYQLHVYTCTITTHVTASSNIGGSATMLQWGIAANSSGASLATGAPNPPIRQIIGSQFGQDANKVGYPFTPSPLVYNPKTPLVCNGGAWLQVFFKVPLGGGSFNVRGSVAIDGYFE